MKDIQGLEVSTDDHEIITTINFFYEQVLSYGNSSHTLTTTASQTNKCSFLHILASYALLLRENVDRKHNFLERAAEHIKIAKDNPKNEREEAHFKVVLAVYNEQLQYETETIASVLEYASDIDLGENEVAVMLEEIVEKFPNDIFTLKLAHIHYFNLGDSQAMLRAAKKATIDRSHRFHHYLLGMLAFAYVECGHVEEAERLGREATQLAPSQRDPWAHHAVAHCMEITGRLDDGIKWMEGHSKLWDDCCSFMYTHNWWHTALFYLDRGASETVLDLYEKRVWGICKENAQDQLGAASLLWRLNLRNVDVAERWNDVADHVAPHIKEHIQPFIDLHYVYALAKAGKDEKVSDMLLSLEETARYARKQKEVALPLAKAVVSHAKGDFNSAYEVMGTIYPRIKEIGGSNAQLDMFEQTYIDVLYKSGKVASAKSLLSERVKTRPNTPVVLEQLSQACAQNGDTESSAKFSERATYWTSYYRNHTPWQASSA
eukprot:Phypoly_transcript_07037.p1 GENE.Phypoly_transcript_07037~~Phypoly_transcript_07037.p1  ORF type:complete len:490 (+),score=73.23 Phypoly_transcript_07037:64-1533(+)